ncbi:probable G-protein coupled receptor frpr-1 [Haliotis asinina]|uniref:probable G-protein coupled receptor frpr-1 n=1 Tax=Haliotis asinina TaxID=109174 RepID=UPI003531BC75
MSPHQQQFTIEINISNGQEEEISDSEINLSGETVYRIIAWVLTVIATCGVFGNTLGAAVLHRMQKTNGNIRLLKYLSLVDTVLLILVFFGVILFELNSTIHAIFYPYAYLLAMTVYTFEIYLTVLIAIQRCIAITLPFKYESLMRASVINTILGCIALFSVAFNVPLWLAYWPEPYWDTELNMQLFHTNPATSPLGKEGFTAYVGPVMLVFRCVIPLIILVTCNMVLVISRRRMNSGNPQSSDRGSVKLTMLVLAITSMSVLTHVVSAVDLLLFALDFNLLNNLIITRIAQLLIVINSSTNFIFNYVFGNTFLENLKSCFRSHVRAQN